MRRKLTATDLSTVGCESAAPVECSRKRAGPVESAPINRTISRVRKEPAQWGLHTARIAGQTTAGAIPNMGSIALSLLLELTLIIPGLITRTAPRTNIGKAPEAYGDRAPLCEYEGAR